MKPSVVNGYSIENYKDFDVRETGLAVPKAQPRYRPHVSNGFRPDDIILDGLVLYLPLYALKGSQFKSVDAYGHTCTVTGALWRPDGRLFDGADDKITCGSNVALTFASGTIIIWAYSTSKPNNSWLVAGRDGGAGVGYIFLGAGETLSASAGTKYVDGAAGDSAPTATWHHLAVSGIAITLATLPFKIGARYNDLADNWMKGIIGAVWAYDRVCSAEEIAYHRNVTKWRYQ